MSKAKDKEGTPIEIYSKIYDKICENAKKKDMTNKKYARLENISALLGELITACSNTLTQSLMNTQCDTGM
jgi:hypothetical protein